MFTDISSNAFTVTGSGNAQISTAQSKWGGSSLLLDGSGDFVTSPISSEFGITANFTVEFWCYPLTLSGIRILMHVSAGSNNGLHIYANGTELRIDNGLVADYNSGSGVMVLNTWTFIRVTKSGSTLFIAKDGVLLNSRAAQSYGTPNRCSVGHFTGGGQPSWHGHFQDVRITKGYAWSTTSPTLPTAPLAVV